MYSVIRPLLQKASSPCIWRIRSVYQDRIVGSFPPVRVTQFAQWTRGKRQRSYRRGMVLTQNHSETESISSSNVDTQSSCESWHKKVV